MCVQSSYWWCLDDSYGLDNLLSVHLGTWSVEVSDDGGHAGLVAHGCGKVDWFLGVILWEATKRSASAQSSSDFLRTNLLTFPRCRAARFLGRKASEPAQS